MQFCTVVKVNYLVVLINNKCRTYYFQHCNLVSASKDEKHCAISYRLGILKNFKSTHGGVLFLVKACNFTKSNTLSGLFLTFLKLYQWYQIAQSIRYLFSHVTEINQVNTKFISKFYYQNWFNYTARFLKYVWPFYNIMLERVNWLAGPSRKDQTNEKTQAISSWKTYF